MVKQLEKHIAMLTQYANKLCKDPNTADDIVQTTLLKAIEKQDKYIKGTNLSSWLKTILYNTYVDNTRRYKNRQVIDPNTPEIEEPKIEDKREATSLELEFLETLSEIDKRIAILFASGQTRDEIAIIISKPPGTVASKFQRLRKRAKKYIEKHKDVND